jgi:uncharacterized protein (DUF433 family)
MKLEDYFELTTSDTKFGPANQIRIKGHRISLEHVIRPYQEGVSPEAIQRDYYPSLTHEEIKATINYYLQNKVEMDAYLKRGDELEERFYQEYLGQEPSPAAKRLRELSAKRDAEKTQGHG